MATHFRGPLLYSRKGHPLDNLSLDVIQRAILRPHLAAFVGNGEPWLGPAAAGSASSWTLTDVGTGTSTLVMDNTGKLVLTGGTTDEDNSGLQFKGIPFRFSTTRDITFFARVAISTAATSDAFIGLAGVDTTLVSASAIAVDNALGFFKAATATDYTFHARKSATSTTQAMGLTLTNGAYAIVGFTVRNGIIRAYAALDPSNSFLTADSVIGNGIAIAATNAPDTVDGLMSFMIGQEGGTTARSLTIDWAFCLQDIDA